MREKAQRGLVGPVDVVDGHEHRAGGGEVGEQPVEAVAQRIGVGLLAGLPGEVRPLAGLRGEAEGRGRMTGRAREQGGALLGARARHRRLEQSPGDSECDVALEL